MPGDAPTASPVEAAARLRHVVELRGRARRATLLPSFALLAGLGAVLVAHGLVVAAWPHSSVAWLAWLAAILVARPALRGGTDLPAARLWAACAAAALAGMLVAEAAGFDPLLHSIGAALALRAALARRPVAAVAVVVVVAAVDALGVSTAAGELAVGAALITAGLAVRAREGRTA
jgi:hypothetical protein